MLYHGLPVIPEDDVLDELVLSNHNVYDNYSHLHSNKNRATSVTTTNAYAVHKSEVPVVDTTLSPFGYVAIVRNETVLLEIGRSPFDIYDENCSDDDDSYGDDFSAATALDQTVVGLMQTLPNSGWDRYPSTGTVSGTSNRNDHPGNTISDQVESDEWIGLRFHCYDHDDCHNETHNDDTSSHLERTSTAPTTTTTTTIWSFCVVYTTTILRGTASPQEAPLEVIIQQWMMEHMVQFTKLFRQSDVVWKTGTLLSCQYLFAPVLRQRMMILQQLLQHQSPQQAIASSSENKSSLLNWMDIANEIVEQNHDILRKTTMATPTDTAMEWDTLDDATGVAVDSNSFEVPPFVSDESDNDEDDEGNDDDVVTSSSDEEDEDDLLLRSTPVRTGALPMSYYYNHMNHPFDDNENDGNNNGSTYLDHIVASTTSIWTKQAEVSVRHVTKPPPPNRISVTEIISPPHPHPIDTDIHPNQNLVESITAAVDLNCDSFDSNDDETIPLICFVGDQVDAQHSDLWKRSPKCITKAVALGITSQPATVSVLSIDKMTSHPPTLVGQTQMTKPIGSMIDKEVNAWWKVFAQTTATTFDVLWKHATNQLTNNRNNNDELNRNTNNNANDNDHDGRHPCFWCESIFPSKVSAMQSNE